MHFGEFKNGTYLTILYDLELCRQSTIVEFIYLSINRRKILNDLMVGKCVPRKIPIQKSTSFDIISFVVGGLTVRL